MRSLATQFYPTKRRENRMDAYDGLDNDSDWDDYDYQPHEGDRDYWGSDHHDPFCICEACYDAEWYERQEKQIEWEREDRERKLDEELGFAALGPEDFGLREPRRFGSRFGTYDQPAEKNWKGPQWARHKPGFNPRARA